jgi:hypothetical protein
MHLRNRNWSLLLILLGVLTVMLFLISNYPKFSIENIMGVLIGVYIIGYGIQNHQSAILNILIGITILISILIWNLFQTIPAIGMIVFLITSALFIASGLLVYSGHFPKKWS